jgi:hypothetical protein
VGVYDQAGRYAIKCRPSAFFTWRAPALWAAWKFVRWQDTRTLPFPGAPDRVCDTVAEFEQATTPRRRCLVDVEVQARPDPDMLERLGEYALILRRERRHGPAEAGKFVVLGLLVNLTGAEQSNRLDMSVPGWGDAAHRLQVAQAKLSGESADTTLAQIDTAQLETWVLVWLPLLQGAAEAVNIAKWKRLAAQEPDSRSRSDFGALALVFAELAGTASLWRKALKGWNMTESPQVLEWQQEARLETRKEYLQQAVQLRFGMAMPADLAERLVAVQNAAEVDRWFRASQTAPSLDAFRAAVQNGKRKRKRSQ